MKNYWLDRKKKDAFAESDVKKLMVRLGSTYGKSLSCRNGLYGSSWATAILGGQRLWNEQPYALKVRAKNYCHMHGFDNEIDLYNYLDMLKKDANLVFLGCEGDQSLEQNEVLLTVYRNHSWHEKDREILLPASSGGEWIGYDDWCIKNQSFICGES